jgi:hypothetical protein
VFFLVCSSPIKQLISLWFLTFCISCWWKEFMLYVEKNYWIFLKQMLKTLVHVGVFLGFRRIGPFYKSPFKIHMSGSSDESFIDYRPKHFEVSHYCYFFIFLKFKYSANFTFFTSLSNEISRCYIERCWCCFYVSCTRGLVLTENRSCHGWSGIQSHNTRINASFHEDYS